MARHSHAQVKKRSWWKYGGILLAVVGGLSALSSVWLFWRVTNVTCQTNAGESCPERVTQELRVLQDSRFLFTNHRELVSRALSSQPFQLVSLTKKSGVISVVVEPVSTRYQLESQGKFWLADSKGVLFPTEQRLPVVTRITVTDPSLNLGEVTQLSETQHQFWSSVVKALADERISFDSLVAIQPNIVVARLTTGQQAILDATAPELQVRRLKTIVLQQDQLSLPEPIVEIDVRYKLPVLRTQATVAI